jgi:hypothetical protein
MAVLTGVALAEKRRRNYRSRVVCRLLNGRKMPEQDLEGLRGQPAGDRRGTEHFSLVEANEIVLLLDAESTPFVAANGLKVFVTS